MVQKADGDYDGALQSLRTVSAKYPRDRVVLNQIGRILFLKREYKQAVDALQRRPRCRPGRCASALHSYALLSRAGRDG